MKWSLFFWSKNENPPTFIFQWFDSRMQRMCTKLALKQTKKKKAFFGKRMKNPLHLHFSVVLVTNEKRVVQTPRKMTFFWSENENFPTLIFIFQRFQSQVQKAWTKLPLKWSAKKNNNSHFWKEIEKSPPQSPSSFFSDFSYYGKTYSSNSP